MTARTSWRGRRSISQLFDGSCSKKTRSGTSTSFDQRDREAVRDQSCDGSCPARRPRHKNAFLQASWNKRGEGVFTFHVLMQCSVPTLVQWEQIAIDAHRSMIGWEDMYNLSPTAGSQLGIKHSDRARQRMSANLRGKPGRHTTPHTEETKRKISEAVRQGMASLEVRRKMSQAKMGKARPPFTAETLAKMSEAQKRVSANARKTHCVRGHPLPTERRRDGRRANCSPCMKLRTKEFLQRRQASS